MCRIRKPVFFFCIMLSLICPFTYGQFDDDECKKRGDCPKKEDEFELDEVIVTAFHGGAVNITPTKTIIDIEAFDKSGAVERVEDILTHLTGIDVLRGTSGADPQQLVMMRGFDDSRFTIAIDGRTITGPTAGADTYVDWSSLTSADIDKIEVIRGAASAQYENSQGGIINIITRKGSTRETLKPKITFTNDYSRYNTFTSRVAVDGGFKDLTYFFNYGYKTSDGFLLNNDYEGYDYSARVSYLFPFEGYLTLGVKYSQLKAGYAVVNDPNSTYTNAYNPNYPIVPQDADTIRRYRAVSFPGGDNYKDKDAQHLDLSFDQPFNRSKLKVQIYESSGGEDSYYYTVSAGRLQQLYSGGDARAEKQIGGRLQWQMDYWENNSLLLGYDQRRMEVKSTPDVWCMNALYAEDTLAITNRLTAFLGLRYAHVREFTYAYSDVRGTPAYRHKLYTRVLLPKSTLTYKFTDDTQVYVSVNRDYHVPGC